MLIEHIVEKTTQVTKVNILDSGYWSPFYLKHLNIDIKEKSIEVNSLNKGIVNLIIGDFICLTDKGVLAYTEEEYYENTFDLVYLTSALRVYLDRTFGITSYTLKNTEDIVLGSIDNRYGVWHLSLEDNDADGVYNTTFELKDILAFMETLN